MSVNINKLSEEELVDLNNRIVERLRFLHQARAPSLGPMHGDVKRQA